MSSVIEHSIDIGLRMYGNGQNYPRNSVKLIEEFCREEIGKYFVEHQRLIDGNKKIFYLSTLVYRLREKRIGLKRLEQYLQAKDRSSTQDEQFVKEKKLTILNRFQRIIHRFRLDNHLVGPLIDSIDKTPVIL